MPLEDLGSPWRLAGRPHLRWSADPVGAGFPSWPCTAARWPRRTGVSSQSTRRPPQHLRTRDRECTYSLPTPPAVWHPPASLLGHTPSSTMMSPSFREAPRPAQILFIWATRARLPFSLASSSSLAAGLQTHTPLRLLPWCPQGCRGREPLC